LLYRFAESQLGAASGGLIEKGANPSLVPEGKPSLVVLAARNGMIALARHIVKVLPGALADKDDLDNPVPMIAAYRSDPFEVRWWVSFFIEVKCNLSTMKVPPRQVEESRRLRKKSKLNWAEGPLSENSMLLELVRRGHVDAAMQLWDYLLAGGYKVDHEETDDQGRSLLFYSVYRHVYNDRTPILERILALGTDLSQKDEEGTTPLGAACRAANFKAVIRLLNHPPGTYESACVANGGFNVDDHEDTTWHFSDKWKGCAGNDKIVNHVDEYGNTPLIYASMHQHSYMALALLGAGADPNSMNQKTGMSPLMWAVRGSQLGSYPLCRILMEAGADACKVDLAGRNAIDFAFMHVCTAVCTATETGLDCADVGWRQFVRLLGLVVHVP